MLCPITSIMLFKLALGPRTSLIYGSLHRASLEGLAKPKPAEPDPLNSVTLINSMAAASIVQNAAAYTCSRGAYLN